MRYVLQKTPVPPGKEDKNAKHGRVYYNSKLDMKKMCKLISARSSLSSADVKGVLDSFQFWMGTYLQDGSIVELEGLGHFYPTLKSKCFTDAKGKQQVAVKVDTVGFRCSPELKKQIRDTEMEEVKVHYAGSTSEKRRKNIMEYVNENLHITSSQVMYLNRCSRHTALDDLKALTAEKKLLKAGSRKSCVYFSAPVVVE